MAKTTTLLLLNRSTVD